MNVLSLFDGISGAQLALKKLGVVPNYYASEIDEYAIKITHKNFPNTIHLGDVNLIDRQFLPPIDLLIGGSPCQDLSVSGKRKGLGGERSRLFWKFVEILNDINPRYFVLENVRPAKVCDEVTITNALGVRPILLDAALVSAQRRRRLFWTNIPNVQRPRDRGNFIKDILEPNAVRKVVDINPARFIKTSYGVRWNRPGVGDQVQNAQTIDQKSRTVDANVYKRENCNAVFANYPQGQSANRITGKSFPVMANGTQRKNLIVFDHDSTQNRAYRPESKHAVITASRPNTRANVFDENIRVERLTWTEIERLQGLPDGYTDLGEENLVELRGRAIGNGFQIDIVAHLLSFMLSNPAPVKRSTENIQGEQINLF